jgi:hypothetical protein
MKLQFLFGDAKWAYTSNHAYVISLVQSTKKFVEGISLLPLPSPSFSLLPPLPPSYTSVLLHHLLCPVSFSPTQLSLSILPLLFVLSPFLFPSLMFQIAFHTSQVPLPSTPQLLPRPLPLPSLPPLPPPLSPSSAMPSSSAATHTYARVCVFMCFFSFIICHVVK